jgi:glycosyltransferase involved in cell wall biosynthesis
MIIQPSVSIIFAAENLEGTRGAIESILSQRYLDLELLLLDDGECEAFNKIIRHFEALDARVKRIGCINSAMGRYLAFATEKDMWSPDALCLLYDEKREALRIWCWSVRNKEVALVSRAVFTRFMHNPLVCHSKGFRSWFAALSDISHILYRCYRKAGTLTPFLRS